MRCKKCGFISFDWLENCAKCGKPMEQEKALIGEFFPDNEKIDWFATYLKGSSLPNEEKGAKIDISSIDVSDLVDEKLEIEEEELKEIAQDQEFQKVLEEITE